MTFASPRALCLIAALAMPTSLIAQASRSPTIFAPSSQNGMVNVRVAVVRSDYSIKPLPLLTIIARKADRTDSLGGKTDLEGRVALSLPAGSYTIRARAAQPIDGRVFSWSIPVTVRGASKQSVELTNANASADSLTAVAAAPVSEPEAPIQPAPAVTKQPSAPVSAPKQTAAAAPATKQPVSAPAPTKQTIENVPTKIASAPANQAPPVVERQPAPNAPAQPSPFDLTSAKSEPRPAAPPPAMRRVEQAPVRSSTSGLFFGLGLNGSSIKSDDLNADSESGGGLEGELGWGFTRHLALFINASAARISSTSGDFDLGHFDVGARWNFASPSRSIAPFIDVAFAGRAAMQSDVVLYDGNGNMQQGDLSIMGSGVSFGGGLNYFVSPKWALGGALKYTMGEFSRVQFDKVSVDGFQIDATSARFNLGFTWFPMGGR
jgi:hypothetical protein